MPIPYVILCLLNEYNVQENPDLIQELASFIPEPTTTNTLTTEVVDFTNQEQLTSVFKKHHVDTVISALFLPNLGEWKVEENLLNAAIEAGVRRFAPSNFAGPVEECVFRVFIDPHPDTLFDRSHSMRSYEFKRQIMALVADAPISYTHFTTGELPVY
jgi:hypothetical protein